VIHAERFRSGVIYLRSLYKWHTFIF